METMQGLLELVTIIDSGGFSAAARTLGISKACVSQRIAQLEDRLGTRLLHRTTRRVSLSEAGEIYYRHAAEMVRGLRETEERVRDFQITPRGKLRISMVDGGLGEQYLAPALARFAAANPEVSLEIDLSSRIVDLVEEGYDLAIRVGELPDSNLMARKLTSFRYGLYASPGYLERAGVPLEPGDLATHNCLAGSNRRWRLSRGERRADHSPCGSWHSRSGQALIAAAREGIGIVRTASFYAAQPLSRGELFELLPDWTQERTGVWLVSPSRHHLPKRVSCAINFLLEEFSGTPPWSLTSNDTPS